MMSALSWLPALLVPADYADEEAFKDAAYQIFQLDFVKKKTLFGGKTIGCKRYPDRDGRGATFRHLTTRDVNKTGCEEDRVFCQHRCSRIRHPKPIIEAIKHADTKCWRAKKKGEWRIYFLVEAASYLVVLSERNGYTLLWTAYIIDENNEMGLLKRQYKRAIDDGLSLW
jgi:hypothetical protein